MEDIFLHNIFPYTTDNDFMSKVSILCKNKKIQERRNHINKIKTANPLKICLNSYYLEELTYSIMTDECFNDYMKECIDRLLDRYSLCNEEIYYFFNTPHIFCKKFVSSQCSTEYTDDGKKQLCFKNMISKDTKICSVYRVTDVRRYMLKNYLTVRALIY